MTTHAEEQAWRKQIEKRIEKLEERQNRTISTSINLGDKAKEVKEQIQRTPLALFEITPEETETISELAQLAYQEELCLVEIAHGVLYTWDPVKKRCNNYPGTGTYALIDLTCDCWVGKDNGSV